MILTEFLDRSFKLKKKQVTLKKYMCNTKYDESHDNPFHLRIRSLKASLPLEIKIHKICLSKIEVEGSKRLLFLCIKRKKLKVGSSLWHTLYVFDYIFLLVYLFSWEYQHSSQGAQIDSIIVILSCLYLLECHGMPFPNRMSITVSYLLICYSHELVKHPVKSDQVGSYLWLR